MPCNSSANPLTFVISPTTISTGRPANCFSALSRDRTSAFTCTPRETSSRTRLFTSNPVAPVTRADLIGVVACSLVIEISSLVRRLVTPAAHPSGPNRVLGEIARNASQGLARGTPYTAPYEKGTGKVTLLLYGTVLSQVEKNYSRATG